MENQQKDLLQLYQSRLRHQLLLDIVNVHPIHGPTLEDVGEYYGFDFSSGRVCLFVLKLVPRFHTGEERRCEAIKLAEGLLRDMLAAHFSEFELCNTADFMISLLALSDGASDWKHSLSRCFRSLCQTGALSPFHLILGEGPESTDAETLCQGFRAAMNALELGVMYGYGRIYDSTDLEEILPLDCPVLSPVHQAVLQDLLTARDSGQLTQWLKELFSEMAPVFSQHPGQAFRLPREIMQRADAIVQGLPGAEIFRQGVLLDCCVTLDQEQAALADIFQRFCSAAPSTLSAAVSAAQSYIALHFREPLTLEQLSGLAGLNPQYLSTLYRQETGQTISRHIRFLRVLAAQSLLRNTQLPVERISQQVGYEDPRYFSRVFQSTTGESPSQYRKGV